MKCLVASSSLAPQNYSLLPHEALRGLTQRSPEYPGAPGGTAVHQHECVGTGVAGAAALGSPGLGHAATYKELTSLARHPVLSATLPTPPSSNRSTARQPTQLLFRQTLAEKGHARLSPQQKHLKPLSAPGRCCWPLGPAQVPFLSEAAG